MQSADYYLTEYGKDHQNTVNRALHKICVPAIVVSRRSIGTDYWYTWRHMRALRYIARYTTHYVANSHAAARHAIRYEALRNDRVSVIPNGLNTAAFHQIGEDCIIAASDLGDHLQWDLSVLTMDYCKLMQDVWARVLVEWKDGKPVSWPPPVNHRCRTR